ncbi:MAG: class I SAM-dependent methyltransferase, partial [Pirellulales bacterium]
PGLAKFWIDKTVAQLLAVGCCVVHPELSYPLPDGGLRDGVHYIRCADDYSDVRERLGAHRGRLREIGANGQAYFQQHLTPHALWEYVRAVVRQRKRAGETIKVFQGVLVRTDEIMRDIRHIDRYRRARTYAHGRVLDFGSGSGYGARILRGSKLVTSVLGVEADADVLRYSRANHQGENVSFAAEAREERFDTVVALEVLEHLADLNVFRRAVTRARPDTVIISFPAAPSRHIVKWHVRDIQPAEIDAQLDDYRSEVATAVNDGESVFRVYRSLAKSR